MASHGMSPRCVHRPEESGSYQDRPPGNAQPSAMIPTPGSGSPASTTVSIPSNGPPCNTTGTSRSAFNSESTPQSSPNTPPREAGIGKPTVPQAWSGAWDGVRAGQSRDRPVAQQGLSMPASMALT